MSANHVRARAMVLVGQGLVPALLDSWMRANHLPTLARLREDGGSGPFVSEQVPYEPPTLMTAFTGHPLGAHGCYSYWTAQDHDYRPQVVLSTDLGRPLLWNRPDFDASACIVNLFGTHPPMPLNGCLITYPMRQTLHACHPKDLLVQLSREGIRCTHDVSHWFSGGAREDFVRGALDADIRRARAAELLWRTRRPDLLVLVLTAMDRLSHAYWQELEPGSPLDVQDSAVFRAYRQFDAIVGGVLANADPSTNLLLFSDVGFGPLRSFCSMNDVLVARGFLSEASSASPDWPETLAYETVQGTHGVNVNLHGRQRHGTVAPRDYERVRADVADVLLAALNPLTGLPLLRRVIPREELYSGPMLTAAPDLVVEPFDERYLPLGEPGWARHVSRHLQSGWHRRDSIWMARGPAFDRSGAMRPASAIDIAPTIVDMLDREPVPDFVGSSLAARR